MLRRKGVVVLRNVAGRTRTAVGVWEGITEELFAPLYGAQFGRIASTKHGHDETREKLKMSSKKILGHARSLRVGDEVVAGEH
jgi:hypothetical protein